MLGNIIQCNLPDEIIQVRQFFVPLILVFFPNIINPLFNIFIIRFYFADGRHIVIISIVVGIEEYVYTHDVSRLEDEKDVTFFVLVVKENVEYYKLHLQRLR